MLPVYGYSILAQHNHYFLWNICTLLTKASLFQFIQYTVNINV